MTAAAVKWAVGELLSLHDLGPEHEDNAVLKEDSHLCGLPDAPDAGAPLGWEWVCSSTDVHLPRGQ